MTLVVSLRKAVDENDTLMDGWSAYPNSRAGEIYTLQDGDAE
jgi:hypothetical protein